jgi:hypothetical protein
MKPYVCPRCFKPSPAPDARGACPACGYTTGGSRLLLWLSLTILAVILLLAALATLYSIALNF